jgi:hypothetical protein
LIIASPTRRNPIIKLNIMNATSPVLSPMDHSKQDSIHNDHVARPTTPIRLATDDHDPDSPCMIALPSTPTRTAIPLKPSMTTLHSPRRDLEVEIELDLTPAQPHYHHFYNGTKSAASSATAFDTNILHGSESYLIMDPRNNARGNGHTIQDTAKGNDGAQALKRKKVDFNKPLKFWLIFVSLCFSCLLSALDLVSYSCLSRWISTCTDEQLRPRS